MAEISQRFDALGADGAPCKLGLMGGTFDPVHIAHLELAEKARCALGLDAVLFIPTGNPVFKRDIEVTPAQTRLAMVRSAVGDNPFFDASAIEIERGGDTYTVDTLRELREHYPSNVEFFFITGSDAARDLWKWKEAAEIARLTKVVVATRPGSVMGENDLAKIRQAASFDFSFIEAPALEIASSDLRARARRGESVRYLVPPAVYETICELGLYRSTPRDATRSFDDGDAGVAACDADPFSDEFIAARTVQLRSRVKPKRFRHIQGVACAAEDIARAYGVDARAARLGGLLHDWDKGLDDDDIRERARELGVPALRKVFDEMPQLLHGPTAAAALGRSYPQIPACVLQAVSRHTTGACGMSDLDMVVYVADAIEVNRDYPGVKHLRKLVGRVPLETLFVETFAHTLENLLDRGLTVHPSTVEIWNYYATRDSRDGQNEGIKRND